MESSLSSSSSLQNRCFNLLCCPSSAFNDIYLRDCKICYFGHLYGLKLLDPLASYCKCARVQTKMISACLILQLIIILLSGVVLYVVFPSYDDDDYVSRQGFHIQLEIEFGLSLVIFGLFVILAELVHTLENVNEIDSKYITRKLVIGISLCILILLSQLGMDVNEGIAQLFYLPIWLYTPIYYPFLLALIRYFTLYYISLERFRGGGGGDRDTTDRVTRRTPTPVFQPQFYGTGIKIEETNNPVNTNANAILNP